MKSASINEIKKELRLTPPSELLDICLRMAKYKKENKELLSYLLFDSGDELGYIQNVKVLIDEQFSAINRSNIYFFTKMLRKVLRVTNKYIRYSGNKQTEVEILIWFSKNMKNSGIVIEKSIALSNIYQRLIIRIQKALDTLHEDLQYDYSKELNGLQDKL